MSTATPPHATPPHAAAFVFPIAADAALPAVLPDAPPTDAPPPDDAHLPAPLDTSIDAHGHDPADFDWLPVLRKPRADGWTPDKQRLFIETLADLGSVKAAVEAVGMSEASAYRLRRSPGAQGFDRAWSAAIATASKRLIDVAMQRAMIGYDEAVVDKDGHFVYYRTRLSEKLLMFLLRSYMPERFGATVQERRAATPRAKSAAGPAADSAAGPAAPPDPVPLGEYSDPPAALAPPAADPADPACSAPLTIARAIAEMLPVAPADPAALIPPDRLADSLDNARRLNGALPPLAPPPPPPPRSPRRSLHRDGLTFTDF